MKRAVASLKRVRPVQPEDVAIPVLTGVGEVAQVDFGYVGKLYDPTRGRLRKAWVFVMVLAYSRHRFDRVVFDQKTETWLALHVEAFEAFGGVPDTLVPDNLKAAVVRAAFGVDRDQTALNRSFRELARHYDCKIDPAPPRAPKAKGRVESGVKYVKNNFFKPREFDDIDDANTRLDRWIVDIAGERTHGTTGRRPLEVFEQEERETLIPLPAKPYQQIVWKQAKVHLDCHVAFDRQTYPVPWRFIGKEMWLRATPKSVEIHYDDVRIITHERGVPAPPEIVDQCLPEHRRDLRYRSRGYWLDRADALGEEVGTYIRDVFDSDDVLSMLRTVQGIVKHLETFPPERASAACLRAGFYGNYTYRGLRDILRKGLDLQPLPAVLPAKGHLDAPRFARSPKELLQLPLEITDEPN